MQNKSMSEQTARQLRPVVISVIAANLAVFTLLMATANMHGPMTAPAEMVAFR